MENLIKAARGKNPADVVLKNGTVIDVLGGTLVKGDVAIVGDTIIGIGKYKGKKEIDCTNRFICPGFIDTHMHVESSMLSPAEFARTVLAHGTTTVVADPHEIANVCGMAGVEYIKQGLASTPLNALVMLPSCVPATPFESSGAVLDYKIIQKHIKDFPGLGEFMNFPGIINCDSECIAKVNAARKADKIIDGHAVGLDNPADFNAYAVTGARTNHECLTADDLRANIARGIYVSMREGSYGKNVAALVKGITPQNMRRCTFCTDDKHLDEIIATGHINNNIRVAVANGLDPISAVTIATLNASESYFLKQTGAIAPGYIADICVVDNMKDFNVTKVLSRGLEINDFLFKAAPKTGDIVSTVHIKAVRAEDFARIPNDIIIKVTPGNIITEYGKSSTDKVKIAVIERHKATGNIGVAWVTGLGLKSGAIAQTIAHDSHNIIVIGADDGDMAIAVNELARVGGGICIVNRGKVAELLPLEVAGLMTERLTAKEMVKSLERLNRAALNLGVSQNVNIFIELSFLALPVIPHIKITDKGLFDVDKFEFIAQ